jgi:hypothetical protein
MPTLEGGKKRRTNFCDPQGLMLPCTVADYSASAGIEEMLPTVVHLLGFLWPKRRRKKGIKQPVIGNSYDLRPWFGHPFSQREVICGPGLLSAEEQPLCPHYAENAYYLVRVLELERCSFCASNEPGVNFGWHIWRMFIKPHSQRREAEGWASAEQWSEEREECEREGFTGSCFLSLSVNGRASAAPTRLVFTLNVPFHVGTGRGLTSPTLLVCWDPVVGGVTETLSGYSSLWAPWWWSSSVSKDILGWEDCVNKDSITWSRWEWSAWIRVSAGWKGNEGENWHL